MNTYTPRESREQSIPVDILLFCPRCSRQHIDDGYPPHRSHLCLYCRHIWRPADVATNGVAAIKTHGVHDGIACGGDSNWKLSAEHWLRKCHEMDSEARRVLSDAAYFLRFHSRNRADAYATCAKGCEELMKQRPSLGENPHGGGDRHLLDWVEENEAHLVSHREQFGADEGEYTIWWQVVKNRESISGHPLGSVRAAIMAAIGRRVESTETGMVQEQI